MRQKYQYTFIIEASMFSTPDISTGTSTISPGPSVTVKNSNARKPIRLFTAVFGVKRITAVQTVRNA